MEYMWSWVVLAPSTGGCKSWWQCTAVSPPGQRLDISNLSHPAQATNHHKQFFCLAYLI